MNLPVRRQGHEDRDCWMEMGLTSSLILGVPVAAIVLANLAMLANVVMVVRNKLAHDQVRVGRGMKQEKSRN